VGHGEAAPVIGMPTDSSGMCCRQPGNRDGMAYEKSKVHGPFLCCVAAMRLPAGATVRNHLIEHASILPVIPNTKIKFSDRAAVGA